MNMSSPLDIISGVSRFIYLDETDSTNTYARQLIERDDMPRLPGIVVVRAGRQISGRGRQGRTFFSSVGGGLWVSIIIGVDSIDTHFSVNRALSLAVSDTVAEKTGRAAFIKWPNDVICADKKICGILLESAENRGSPYLIAGFGLNVNIEAVRFPADIAPIATSMRIESGKLFDIDTVLAAIIKNFIAYFHMSCTNAHRAYELRLYRTGGRIFCDGREGIFDGVEPDGRMRMLTESGILHFVSGTMRFI